MTARKKPTRFPGYWPAGLGAQRSRKGMASSQKSPLNRGVGGATSPAPSDPLFAEKGNSSIKIREMGFSIHSDILSWF